ncbi:MAG TPA: amidohydrolase family protein [Candidatus Polarisedimenticolaceae bacterium]
MQRIVAGGIVAALLCSPRPVHAERPLVYAIEGATVLVAPGRTLENATVVVRDGRIEAAGREVRVPADAVPIAGKGTWVWAAFLDAGSTLGQNEPEPARRPPPGDAHDDFGAAEPPSGSLTAAGPAHAVPRVRAEFRAIDALKPFAGDAKFTTEPWRRQGVGAVLVQPSRGLFRGESSVVLLADDRPVAELVVRAGAAQHVAFESGSFGEGYPTSLMGAVAAIRQTLLDARRFAAWQDLYARDPRASSRPEYVAAFEALRPVLERRRRAIVQADDPADVLIAGALAREFDLDVAVAGTGFEAELAAAVRATGLPILFPAAVPDRPKAADADEALALTLRDLTRYNDASGAPRRLHEAGVRFALTSRGLRNPSELGANLRAFVEAGLPSDVALAALTTVPAEILGVDRQLGTVEPGKIANLVLADGPPFAKGTTIRRMFLDGREVTFEEKRKPKGDPSAKVDPRGTWSVIVDFGGGAATRTWTIEGTPGALRGTAETQRGTVTFERVVLEGNLLTVVFPPQGGRPATEASVVVTGDEFEGTAEFGSRTVDLGGKRTKGPEGGAR